MTLAHCPIVLHTLRVSPICESASLTRGGMRGQICELAFITLPFPDTMKIEKLSHRSAEKDGVSRRVAPAASSSRCVGTTFVFLLFFFFFYFFLLLRLMCFCIRLVLTSTCGFLCHLVYYSRVSWRRTRMKWTVALVFVIKISRDSSDAARWCCIRYESFL